MKKSLIGTIKSVLNKDVAHGTSRAELFVLGSFLACIALAYFPIFTIVSDGYNSILNYPSDFAAVKLYAVFIALIIFVVSTIVSTGLTNFFTNKVISILVIVIAFLTFQTLRVEQALFDTVAFQSLLITCVLLFGYAVYKSGVIRKYPIIIVVALLITGSVNSVVSIFQFLGQTSIGLAFLGESTLSPASYGVAKVVNDSTPYIRGYGLFPHPNILAFMILPTLISIVYLLNNTIHIYTRVILSTLFILTTFGLFLSFSRVGVFAGIVMLLVLLILFIGRSGFSKELNKLWLVPIGVIVVIALTFPWWVQRAEFKDNSAPQRVVLNESGREIALNNWFFGTGAGTSMFHMEQKVSARLDEWDIQPPHNYLIILVMELGILGIGLGGATLYFLYQIFRKTLSKLYQVTPIIEYIEVIGAISTAIAIILWFDHYLYTYLPAQLVLVGVLAYSFRFISKKRQVLD